MKMKPFKFTEAAVRDLLFDPKGYWVSDAECHGLRLHVGGASKVWYVAYTKPDGKKASWKLARADVMKVVEARAATRDFLARVARGETPWVKAAEGEAKPIPTLGEWFEGEFAPWYAAGHPRKGNGVVKEVRHELHPLFSRRIDTLCPEDFEAWQQRRKAEGVRNTSIISARKRLNIVFNRAVAVGALAANPLKDVVRLPDDGTVHVRYLSPDERARLMAAIDRLPRGARVRPYVLLAMNTGLRAKELTELEWRDVHLDGEAPSITIRAEVDKEGKASILPLNKEAVAALVAWREVTGNPAGGARVLGVKSTATVKHDWNILRAAAGLDDFRFHDLRHDFASQLVMSGVDLYTVAKLMRHSNVSMTQRYAHLAPSTLRAAVARLEGLRDGQEPRGGDDDDD